MYPLDITWFLSVITQVRHILNFGPALVGDVAVCVPRTFQSPFWKPRDWIGCGSSWVPTQSKITRHWMWGALYLKCRRYPTSSSSTYHCSLCSLKRHQTLLIFCVYGTCQDVINSCDPHRPLYKNASLRGIVRCCFFNESYFTGSYSSQVEWVWTLVEATLFLNMVRFWYILVALLHFLVTVLLHHLIKTGKSLNISPDGFETSITDVRVGPVPRWR